MLSLNFTVKNQVLTCRNNEDNIVQKTNRYIKLHFDFEGEDWENLTKYCVIRTSSEKNYLFNVIGDIILSDDLTNGKWFIVSIYGTSNDFRITTNKLKFLMKKSGYTTDLSSLNPSVDVIEDIYIHLDSRMETEIKKGYRMLENQIRIGEQEND